jgi:hypothetical protein
MPAIMAIDETHCVSFHLCERAALLHLHWISSKDQPQLRFVNEESRYLIAAQAGMVVGANADIAGRSGFSCGSALVTRSAAILQAAAESVFAMRGTLCARACPTSGRRGG